MQQNACERKGIELADRNFREAAEQEKSVKRSDRGRQMERYLQAAISK
jgi:hypothetical protein